MPTVSDVTEKGSAQKPQGRNLRRAGPLLALAILLIAGLAYRQEIQASLAALWRWLPTGASGRTLRWLVALLPGCIILNHVVYLMSSRRKQFREALKLMQAGDLQRLEDLYFGYTPMMVRYVVPAILVTVLCSAAIAALSNPQVYVQWLYPPFTSVPQQASEFATQWPEGWGAQALRGAALGFVGAYVYLLILLTDRARQRDITTGIAVWAATMPVLGPLMGGVASLLLLSGAGPPLDGSFTRDAVFFVAGMLPRQFASFVQGSVRRMFQSDSPVVVRSLPLVMLRGVGPDVEARLEEEGIHDISALAYASPHQLMRATTYSARQIVDWIDEALLIATVPSHWEPLEKAGVTGAMDLAWYETRPTSIATLADEIKMPGTLLADVVSRLWQDAQVADLYQLYWDHAAPVPSLGNADRITPDSSVASGAALLYTFSPGIERDARERLIAEIRGMAGVRSAVSSGDDLTVTAEPDKAAVLSEMLRSKMEIAPRVGLQETTRRM
jgi:hypothetical protein